MAFSLLSRCYGVPSSHANLCSRTEAVASTAWIDSWLRCGETYRNPFRWRFGCY